MAWAMPLAMSGNARNASGRCHMSAKGVLKLTASPSRLETKIPSAVASRVAATSDSVLCNSASLSLRASSARRRAVMSRMMVAPPTTSPDGSRRHETLTETSTRVPSFRNRSVSNGSTLDPFRS